ncbi:MAG: hypothetical protein M1832_005848 [Thelocarpon impressellum]|nr:MAG: hypothetical protein M1832_005848 [Thelocarpon impressellum]
MSEDHSRWREWHQLDRRDHKPERIGFFDALGLRNNDAESPFDNGHFLSFEEWKKQNLARAGQSAEHVGEKRAGPGPEARRRPGNINNALDWLGEDSEIELDFRDFVGPGSADEAASPSPEKARYEGGDKNADRLEEGVPASPGRGRSKDAGKTFKERFNYASFDCAATVLKTNPQCASSSSILVENKDSYMLNQCRAGNKFIIVELCDIILVDTLVLANFEFFSSMFRTVRVAVSDRYPAKPDAWRELGVFEARNSRDVQAFAVPNPLIWAKYLRVEFLSHYGHEYYCPVSLLRVHGTTMMEEFRAGNEGVRGEEEDEVEESEGEAVLEQDVPAHEKRALEDTQTPAQPGSARRSGPSAETTMDASIDASTDAAHIELDAVAKAQANATTDIVPTRQATAPQSRAISDSDREALIFHVPLPVCKPTDGPPVVTIAKSENAPTVAAAASSPAATSSTAADATTPQPSNAPSATPGPQAKDATVLAMSIKSSAEIKSSDSPPSSSSSVQVTSKSTATSKASSCTTSSTQHLPPESSSSNSSSTAGSNTKPPPPSATQPPSPNTTTQESFFKTVHKRLALLESNSTLSLQYIEEQSRILRDAFTKVEKRQLGKTTTFLANLNSTVLTELRGFRQQYDQLWQSTVIELENQREQAQRETLAVSSRLGLLADELVWQKRMAMVQSALLLLCVGLVVFSRSSPPGHHVDAHALASGVWGGLGHNLLARSQSAVRLPSPSLESASSTRPGSAWEHEKDPGRNDGFPRHKRARSAESINLPTPQSPTLECSPPTPTSLSAQTD